uniref:Uncharacterized protein n=1 Tax=Anopheles albimanus TaxID=7167 RepID=A0A182FXE2_ANOAL
DRCRRIAIVDSTTGSPTAGWSSPVAARQGKALRVACIEGRAKRRVVEFWLSKESNKKSEKTAKWTPAKAQKSTQRKKIQVKKNERQHKSVTS